MNFLSTLNFATGLLANWRRLLVYAALAVAVVSVIWGHGYHKGVLQKYEYIADQAKEGARIVVKQGKATERVLTKYIPVVEHSSNVAHKIDEEVTDYAHRNPGLCLDPDWRRLHDRAALNQLPDPAPDRDGPLRAPDAATGRRGFPIGR